MDAGLTEDLGLLLRALRGRAGLTQEELAARAGEGLSARTLRRVEHGQTRPYRHTLEALAAALGLGAEDRRALLAAWRALPATLRRQAPEGAETLPLPPTPLIGREREEATVADLLRRDGARLVTLTGPGGVGKTRLALQAAAGLGDAFADGVIFVELAALGDPRLVPATIAREVGLQEFGERPLPESLIAFLREKRTLLVLDSFEHVAAAAPLVTDLLGACRRLAVLATSRARLDLREEREVVIAPLALPDPANLSHPMSVAESPAVALFTQRARRRGGLCAHRRQRARGSRDLPAPGWAAARPRVGRPVDQAPAAGGPAGAPGATPALVDEPGPGSAAAPADVAQHDRLELRSARCR